MKYYPYICSCGHIHCIPDEHIEAAVKANKNFILICADCGKSHIIGATIEDGGFWGLDEETVYNMYGGELRISPHGEGMFITGKNFDPETSGALKAFSEIYYAHGVGVPMKTGEYARSYISDQFCDMLFPNFSEVQRYDMPVTKIQEWIADFQKNQITVDMDRFIRENDDEVLRCISSIYLRQLDWTGTKYEWK